MAKSDVQPGKIDIFSFIQILLQILRLTFLVCRWDLNLLIFVNFSPWRHSAISLYTANTNKYTKEDIFGLICSDNTEDADYHSFIWEHLIWFKTELTLKWNMRETYQEKSKYIQTWVSYNCWYFHRNVTSLKCSSRPR